MKKDLLTASVVGYLVLWHISLFYAAFEIGAISTTPLPGGYDLLLIPFGFLILSLISLYIRREREYNSVNTYVIMALVTLAYSGIHPGVLWSGYWYGHPIRGGWNDIVLYPAVTLSIAVLIALFYLICAVVTYKEEKS